MKKEAKNEVATKQENAVVKAGGMSVEDWGPASISAQDIIIPRILCMQPTSDLVVEGEAAFGDFISSIDNTKIGDFKNPFEIVPICMEKTWVEYDVTQGDDFKNKKFLRTVPVTPANEALPYKDSESGGKVKISRDKCMNFYVLLANEIDSGGAIPYLLTFRRSSLDGGKTLITQMEVKNKMAGKTPSSVICEISAEKKTNDAGTFSVIKVKPVKPTPDAYVVEAFKWFKLIKAGAAKVDEESYESDEISSAPEKQTGPAQF